MDHTVAFSKSICPPMTELSLLSLPATVINAVLGHIDNLSALVRLDTSYCHHENREIWLALLSSNQFISPCPVDVSNDEELSWVSKRGIQCSSISFSLDIKSNKTVSDFLRFRGSAIRTVLFSEGTKAYEMTLVAMNCKGLTCLRIHDASLTCAMRDIMLRNPNLEEISCSRVRCTETDVFAGVFLHKLKTLHMRVCEAMRGFPWHETSFSDSLQSVILDRCSFSQHDLKALFENCPAVRSFRAHDVNFEDEEIDRLGAGIVDLSLFRSDTLTEANVLSILRRLSSLRTLNIQDCPVLPDRTLQHLVEHAGDRLEVLYVDIKHPDSAETEAILEDFSQKCTKLRYLSINCEEQVLCAGKGTALLLSGCPQLRTLAVNTVRTICGSSRYLAAKLRPELQILAHGDDSTSNFTNPFTF